MKPTFEQMKGAAIDVRRKFFRGCSGAFYNIIECNSERELRFLTIRYCKDISRKYISDYIRGNYEDVLEALGLRFQLYDDGRVRLYLTN